MLCDPGPSRPPCNAPLVTALAASLAHCISGWDHPDRYSASACGRSAALTCLPSRRPPRPSMTEIHNLTAADLARLYRRRELSPVEVARDVLARIERFNPIINAFNIIIGDAALAAAR